MKKLVGILLVLAMCATMLTACGDDSSSTDPSQNGAANNTVTNGDASGNNGGELPVEQTTDSYVGMFYTDHGGRNGYMITRSGAVESIGGYGALYYADNGAFCVWRNGYKLYGKEPHAERVTLCDDVEGFIVQEDVGRAIIFAEDGIYVTTDPSDGTKKISDSTEGYFCSSVSADGNIVAYVDGEGGLHLLNMTTYDNKVIDTGLTSSSRVVYCESETYVEYYNAEKGAAFIWDGTQSVEQPEDFKGQYDYTYIDEATQLGIKEYEVETVSENGEFLVTIEDDDVYRYHTAADGYSEKTLIAEHMKSSAWFVTNDGIVCYGKDYTCYYQGETVAVDGDLPYCNVNIPIIGDMLYYQKDGKLMTYSFASKERTEIAQNVKTYTVKNGYCYYVDYEDNLYRTDLVGSIFKDEIETRNALIK